MVVNATIGRWFRMKLILLTDGAAPVAVAVEVPAADSVGQLLEFRQLGFRGLVAPAPSGPIVAVRRWLAGWFWGHLRVPYSRRSSSSV